jgi:hypothetical protein
MSIQTTPDSGIIEISSTGQYSPGSIRISSDSSPAAPDTFSYPRWNSHVTDRSIYLGSSGLGSGLVSPVPAPRLASPALAPRFPSLLPGRVPHSANLARPMISSRSVAPSHSVVSSNYADHNIENELGRLHEQCEALHTENSELKGQVESLRCTFTFLLHIGH